MICTGLEKATKTWFLLNRQYKPNMNILKDLLVDLVRVLNTLTNVYPEGHLHDCDNPGTDNPVIRIKPFWEPLILSDMAFELLKPVYNQLPNFQPNQVLTYNRPTRWFILPVSTGAVYKKQTYWQRHYLWPEFQWQALAAPNAQVIIEDGVAVTSAGYLVISSSRVPERNNHSLHSPRRRI